MTNQEEVNLPESGTELVSSPAPKKRIKEMTPDEKKKYNREAAKRTREKAAMNSAKAARVVLSDEEVSKKEAKRILWDERRIQNEHVADTVIELAEVAARHHNIPFNAHLFTHGLRLTLAAQEMDGEPAPPQVEAEEVGGEILHRTDLYALWDMGFHRNPQTFEEWLAERYRLKSSAFELSKILGKQDFGAAHESWTAFAPRWNPLGLKPGYTQQEGLAWLDSQRSDTEGDKKRYLLIASRNSMKSTWVRILALALTITYPDARILIVSETNKLSKKAMKEFRGYLEASPNNPSLFQQYFAELCITPDDGKSQTYENPLARLGLPQSSVESSSMESSNTGSRFDFCVFDDPISRDNGTSNDEQKEAALSKHGSIMKLREPAGFAINVQTPWAIGDLGDVMIRQNNEDPEHALAVRIDPVITILPGNEKKPLLELTEDDVILNFLPKLNWKFVRSEMRSPEGLAFFKTQYLCQWPPEEDEGLTVSFTEEEIRARIKPAAFFDVQPQQNVMSLDRAFSTSRLADFSVIAAGRIFRREGRTVCGILEVKLERWKQSELVENIVSMIARYAPLAFVLEKDKGYENLVETVRKSLIYRNIPVPRFICKDIPAGGKNAQSKAKRIKALELPLSDGRLYFQSSAIWNDVLIGQFVRFDGIKKSGSSSNSKDDVPDAVSLLYETYMPKSMSATDTPATDQQKIDKEVEEENRRVALQQMYERTHGSFYGGTRLHPGPPTPQGPTARTLGRQCEPPPPEPQRQLSPREQAAQRMLSILPPAMRRRG